MVIEPTTGDALVGGHNLEGEQVRKLFSTTRRRIAVVGSIIVLALAGGGLAFAYLTSTGSGAGQAAVAAPPTWRGTAGTPRGPLTPGARGAPQTFTLETTGTGTD